ncbi:zinc ribbon domain-containing protein [Bacillus sp. DX1.1]|uniref:zinc ribbon domain-containing protein n=1 Tax=unclassified Bacillus (in: firmicutes) TaxID=185979 RepID=UPI002570BE80|nr:MULTISPECIES: zinc ribbon domain-containing protein [unclassified Bacillus (in: firmicutes)]MDM5157310.1 zinc ribbon domain-containing protein [Bacillus sp. DX1.1]WJE81537.1 zinc ribbon domain-containing protein [Bacillus sp. DX3.1]
MSDLQTKLGSGMNKLQEGIEQGKMKLQIAQEIAQLNKEIQVQLHKKTEVLLELGQRVYVQLRDTGVKEEPLKKLVAPIQHFDVAIYQARKRIVELQKQQGEKATCECGGSLSISDKFCGTCGKPNPMLAVESSVEKVACVSCNEHIAKNSIFCPVCGVKKGRE